MIMAPRNIGVWTARPDLRADEPADRDADGGDRADDRAALPWTIRPPV